MRAERAAGAVLLLAVALAGCSADGSQPGAPAASGPAPSVTTPSPSPSSSAPLDLRTKAGTVDSPAKVGGYRLGDPSKAVLTAVARAAQQYDQVSTGRVVRSVSKDGTKVGHLVVFGLDDGFTGSETFRGQIVQAVALDLAGEGAEPASASVGGKKLTAATSTTAFAVGWLRRDTLVVVVSKPAQRRAAVAYAAAYRSDG